MLLRHAKAPRRRGTYIVEFALVAVIFFMLFFGIIEYGRIVMVRQVIDHATREGARYAVVHTHDRTTSDVQAHVRSAMAGLDGQLQSLNIQVYMTNPSTGANLGDWRDASFGSAIAVQINGNLQPILPTLFFLPNPLPMQAISVMNSEAN
jgi:Flp pilus assembly protein TadG